MEGEAIAKLQFLDGLAIIIVGFIMFYHRSKSLQSI
jgi:hypothetical protein